jgi:hypothetical protein
MTAQSFRRLPLGGSAGRPGKIVCQSSAFGEDAVKQTYFQIEKRYYQRNSYTGQYDILTDTAPILHSSLEDATAYYERSTDPWMFPQGDDEVYFAISEIEPSGLEVGYHQLPQRVSA